MPKEKPLFIAAIAFGTFGFLIFAFAAIVMISKSTSIYTDLNDFFGLSYDTISTAAICELASVFEICACFLSYKSMTEETSENEAEQ